MISYGTSIKSPSDKLNKIELRVLADKIKNPKQEFINKILQLRTVRLVDQKKYRELKTTLPYVVAGIFNPQYRKIINFAYTDYFILDIDHLSEKEMDIENVFEKFKTDNNVVLMFRSPSLDGIKIFFRLEKRCFDAAKYSLFYKVFATEFGKRYSILQVVDNRTSDVSRACFLSYDPGAYYNPEAQPVKIEKYIDFENELQLMELEKNIKEEEKNIEKIKEPDKKLLSDDVFQKIKETLNPRIIEKKEKQIIVPEELNKIIDRVEEKMKSFNIEILSINNINYGKQFRFGMENKWAEVNVFYGKRGFSVVPTTKTGSDQEMAEACKLILQDLLL